MSSTKFGDLKFTCSKCEKPVTEKVKMHIGYKGVVTKNMWCPHCSGWLSMKYHYPQDQPVFLKFEEDDAFTTPQEFDMGITVRPRSK